MKQFVLSLMKALRSTLHGKRMSTRGGVESRAECLHIDCFSTYLCDLVGDVVRAIFDLWSDDGFLGGRRGGALLLIVGL